MSQADAIAAAIGRGFSDLATEVSRRALSTDPSLRDKLRELDGHCVEVRCLQPPLAWHLEVTDGTLTFKHGSAEAPHASVAGRAQALAAWLLPGGATADLRIDGDPVIVERLTSVLTEFKPDLVAPLSQVLGPQGASTILGAAEAGLAGIRALMEGVGRTSRNRGGDYVSQAQLDSVLHGIDELRLRMDRLAAELEAERRRGDGGTDP